MTPRIFLRIYIDFFINKEMKISNDDDVRLEGETHH